MNKFSAFAFGAAIGCAAGVVATLVLTPRSGEETRQLVKDKAEGFSGGKAACDGDGSCPIRQTAGEALNKAVEFAKGLGHKESEMTPEELRAKIEAARERIIAQNAALAQEESPE